MTTTYTNINSKPLNTFCPEPVDRLLAIADSYLRHADQLIYSFGSKTFLSGYNLYDAEHDNHGNIDCSTFVLLVLAGVAYEQSPYGSGNVNEIPLNPFLDMDFSCFKNIPEKYMNIAERIGRPYLSCPKGLDIEKAEKMGISMEQLISEIREHAMPRRSVQLAKHFYERGECFSDPTQLKPGDLVFYQSKTFFRDGNINPENVTEVTHVGIVCQDTSLMINSSGYLDKERAAAESLPAVSVQPVIGKREPVYFARPDYTSISSQS